MSNDIPTLRGWGDDISDLGSGLSHLINPNASTQAALRKAALENPELIPQLAELERSNPGTLQGMGLSNGGILQTFGKGNNLINQIAATPESTKMKEDQQRNAANLAATQASTRNTNANATQTEGVTPGLVKKVTAEGDVAGAVAPDEIASKRAEYKLKAQQSTTQLDDAASALKKFPALSQVDFAKYANDVYNGKTIDPEVTQRIQASGPEAQELVKQYLGAMHQHAELAKDYGVAHLRSKDEALAATGVINQSINEGRQREALVQQELTKSEGSDIDKLTRPKRANPTDSALKNSADAIKAREDLARIEGLRSELTSLKDNNDKMTLARDKILSSNIAVQKAGGLDSQVPLSQTAQQLKQGIESGAIDPRTLSKSKSFNALTKQEQQELLKSKKI